MQVRGSEESHNLDFSSAQDYGVTPYSKLCTLDNNSPHNDREICSLAPCGRGLGRGGKCQPETLSRICNVHSSSRTNSALSQRERAKDEKNLVPVYLNALVPIKKKAAFTLAEVLITLGVIGVVAALTMPTLLKNIAERSNSEAQANLAQKITKSMDLMRADGGLERTYNSTDEFVDEFSKYIKISTRCDAAHIADCWPTKTVTTTDGETYDVSKAKTGKNLNLKDNKSDNVGIILADGATLILTYNPNAGIIGDGDTVTPSFADLPIGFGRTKKFAYTTSVTDPIDFVMDVNGFKGPNSEARNGKQYDIRSFKTARFSTGCAGVDIDGIGCVYVLPSYSPIKVGDPEMKKWDPKYDAAGYFSSPNDWAGAKKACDDIGMNLPDISKLQSIWQAGEKDLSLGIPTSDRFWSSSEYDVDDAFYLFNGNKIAIYKYYSYYAHSFLSVLCVGD